MYLPSCWIVIFSLICWSVSEMLVHGFTLWGHTTGRGVYKATKSAFLWGTTGTTFACTSRHIPSSSRYRFSDKAVHVWGSSRVANLTSKKVRSNGDSRPVATISKRAWSVVIADELRLAGFTDRRPGYVLTSTHSIHIHSSFRISAWASLIALCLKLTYGTDLYRREGMIYVIFRAVRT